MRIHPLVRDLYKRALFVGRDYPLGLEYVRRTWKKALRDPKNCPSCYSDVQQNHHGHQTESTLTKATDNGATPFPSSGSEPYFVSSECERELRKAVGRGRFMIREMIALIQLKKYRSMNQRYTDSEPTNRAASKMLLSHIPQQDSSSQSTGKQIASKDTTKTMSTVPESDERTSQ